MDMVTAVIEWVKANWVGVLAVIGGVDVILGVVVSWTPFKWDDNVYEIVHKIFKKLLGK